MNAERRIPEGDPGGRRTPEARYTLAGADRAPRARLFDEERMYAFVKEQAGALGMEDTLRALPLMREKHRGQTRKGPIPVPYENHPLTMACQALAMGLREDGVVAAMLLHDVVEDTDTAPEQLPVSGRVREAVRLVSKNTCGEVPEEDFKAVYFGRIAKNPLACLVKCVDRCSNLSGMAWGFSPAKMLGYAEETETWVLPLLEGIRAVPEWEGAAWLLRYQITALLEAFKRFL